MFDLGFTAADVRRIVWSFIEGVLGYATMVGAGWVKGGAVDWKALAAGAVVAGYAAVKNGLLAEDSPLK